MEMKKDKFKSLLDSAKKTENRVGQIQSVAPQEENAVIAPDNEDGTEFTDAGKPKRILSEKNGIDYIFVKHDYDRFETVRIPAEIHQKFKLLATCSGVSIIQMVSNILSDFQKTNDHTIQSYVKSHIKSSL